RAPISGSSGAPLRSAAPPSDRPSDVAGAEHLLDPDSAAASTPRRPSTSAGSSGRRVGPGGFLAAIRRPHPRRSTQTTRSVNASELGEALEFMRVLWQLDHSLRRSSKSMESTLGVTGPQRLVIRMVGRFPGLAAGDLASLLHVDPSSLTGILERLGQSGFLART